MIMDEKKFRVKQTTFFSDGSEFTEEFKPNPNAEEIESAVAAAVNNEESEVTTNDFVPEMSEVIASVGVGTIDSETVLSSQKIG